MAIEFLIGPAGSGKTFRCLSQVRDALGAAADGPPLLWIAPKQSTFQLEREVLALGVRGFTRLQVLPFDQVARWVLAERGEPVHRKVLSEEARVMVLHALLLEKENELTVFRRSARTVGFAAQLSLVLRELQRGGIGAERLRQLRMPERSPESLSGKLRDLALLLDSYRQWLDQHHLRDPDDLLDLAASALKEARKTGGSLPQWSRLWLDGFAEMTVSEMDLLVALLPGCERATLAFCLDRAPEPAAGPREASQSSSTTSVWGVTATTYLRCRDRIRDLGLPIQVRHLAENGDEAPRFHRSAPLARLASAWVADTVRESRVETMNCARSPSPGSLAGATLSRPTGEGLGVRVGSWRGSGAPPSVPADGINLVECADPEAEALLAVRLVNQHVRQAGGRYRDVSVIVRRTEGYGDILQRTFRRHGIPYFADQREPMGHHPVAELTRSALHMAAGDWAHENWIGALKSGLVVDNPLLVDHLENAGLAAGLVRDEWTRLDDYRTKARLSEGEVRELERPLAAFARFRAAWAGSTFEKPTRVRTMNRVEKPSPDAARQPLPSDGRGAGGEGGSWVASLNGVQVSQALRVLWRDLRVAETLERWQREAGDLPPLYQAIHHTAWDRIVAWCDDLALAFADTPLSRRDWFTITEAGLSRLTLGVIPPALDEVLIGAIDRARQPEVKLAIVLGLNEGVFPAAPASPALLNRAERQWMAESGLDLGWGPVPEAARENYYGYIACTRASQRLCVAWSRRGIDGKLQVRSSVAERVLALVGIRPDQVAERGDVSAFDGQLKAFSGNPVPQEVVSLPELFECPGWDSALPSGATGIDPAREAAAAAASMRAELQPAEGERMRRLSPETVESLHPGRVLVSSVSALETFAECPFQHFASRQLRLEERDEFQADAAGAGTLLHAILKVFHDRTVAEKGRWRDWLAADAARFVVDLGEKALEDQRFAPLIQDPLVAWETRRRIRRLSAAIAQSIEWMQTCAFDPVLAEFGFGDEPGSGAPPWTLPLEGGSALKLRGRIDRVDVCRLTDGRVLVAVFDYKSTVESPSAAKLEHGLELQLLGYLAFVAGATHLQRAVATGMVAPTELLPGGAFEIPMGPKVVSANQAESVEEIREKYLDSLTYLGVGEAVSLPHFDSLAQGPRSRGPRSRQFKLRQFLEGNLFRDRLESVVTHLRRHASAILDGTVGVQPIRYSAQASACDYCPYRSFCRFEPLHGGFRSLHPTSSAIAGTAGKSASHED